MGMLKISYYIISLTIFLLLKFFFQGASNDDLSFLLKPTNKLVELLTNSQSIYSSVNGYYHSKLNILIDKSCSGFNFLLLCFMLFYYLLVKYTGRLSQKILSLPLAMLLAYFFTIFVNASRIFISIMFPEDTKKLFPLSPSIFHESVGIVIYLSFLIIAYYLFEFLLSKEKKS